MSDDNKNENIDLDSILSEINSTINKEVSKTTSVKSKKIDEQKIAKRPQAKKMPKPKPIKEEKPVEIKPKIDSAFTKSAKIIEHAVEDDDDEIYSNHAVRFIAVTASEVVDEPMPPPKKELQNEILPTVTVGGNSNVSVVGEGEVSPISLDAAPKAAPSPDVARENNHHIQKLRKKQQRPIMSKRQKFIALIGFLMTVLVVIGAVAVVLSTSKFAFRAADKTTVKRELAEEIFPFVIIDIPEFDDIKKLNNSAIISSAIWAFIIDEPDKAKYTYDDLGSIFVPDVDIELYIRKLFGNDVVIKHQTVENTSVMMFYDESTKMYTIESTPKILPYRPRVDKISRKDDIYTLGVSYILPDAMWNFESDKKSEHVGKTMEYVLKKNKNSYQVLSVKLISVEGMVSSDAQQMNSTIISDDAAELDAPTVINEAPMDTSSVDLDENGQPVSALPSDSAVTDGSSEAVSSEATSSTE